MGNNAINLVSQLRAERMTPAQRKSERRSNRLAFGLWSLMIGGFFVCFLSLLDILAAGPIVPMFTA